MKLLETDLSPDLFEPVQQCNHCSGTISHKSCGTDRCESWSVCDDCGSIEGGHTTVYLHRENGHTYSEAEYEEATYGYDPSPWCHQCGATQQKYCDCGPRAAMD